MSDLFKIVALIICMGMATWGGDSRPTRARLKPGLRGGQDAADVASEKDVIDRIVARERDEVVLIRLYRPIVETYLQELRLDKRAGSVPSRDAYFLGQADFKKGTVDRSMLRKRAGPLAGLMQSDFNPTGFLSMIYIDPVAFDKQHYNFVYVGREFIGEIRCFVFDLKPLPKSGKNRFEGRIWVEDLGYTVVRFDGIYKPVQSFGLSGGTNVHFDSWRLNVQPGLWLPALIFSEELNLKGGEGNTIRFKSQTRLWGYSLTAESRETEFSSMAIDSVQDEAESAQQDRSPLQAERDWQHQAELNVIDGLERTGLLAPAGEVDRVLNTVVNNLEVTNNLELDIRCRVLMIGTLEAFSVGRLIVVSRGLLDVLPDEATLAVILAQRMADSMLPRPQTDQYGFSDVVEVSPLDATKRFSFKDNDFETREAAAKAIEILRRSPYRDKLGGAGLFLEQLKLESKSLSALISPRLGNRVDFISQLVNSAPPLDPAALDQIAALPIGARIKLDPWADELQFARARNVPPVSPREKMPFELTPFMPYLTRYRSTPAADPPKSKTGN